MNTHKLKTLIPMEDIEQEAQKQISDVLTLEFLKKLVIMPDVHAGYHLPVGGVALLDGKISPSFVGVDIGCGMCFVNTGIPSDALSNQAYRRIYDEIYKVIPVGFNIREKPLDYLEFKSGFPELNQRVQDKLYKSLGTLGGGNHFIELGSNQSNELCITIHSGSRNIGHSVAQHYTNIGSFFDVTSDLGEQYLRDMNYCLDFALANRLTMIKEVLRILGYDYLTDKILNDTLINENHNHAVITSDGILHRKGATPANKGQLGIIPANMRDGVYITKGLGNLECLSSASHGCGRTMSRTKAKKSILLGDFQKTMSGIIANVGDSTLDEAPFAYKEVNYVINAQKGITVDVIDKITPIVNIKG